jgi:hypothetical protein
MMGNIAVWCSLGIATLSLLLAASCALHCYKLASRVTAVLRARQSAPTKAIADLQADVSALFSTMEKICTTVNRLSSRQGMRALRERETASEPPKGASKAELRKFYGFTNDGPEFARHQMTLPINGTPNA